MDPKDPRLQAFAATFMRKTPSHARRAKPSSDDRGRRGVTVASTGAVGPSSRTTSKPRDGGAKAAHKGAASLQSLSSANRALLLPSQPSDEEGYEEQEEDEEGEEMPYPPFDIDSVARVRTADGPLLPPLDVLDDDDDDEAFFAAGGASAMIGGSGNAQPASSASPAAEDLGDLVRSSVPSVQPSTRPRPSDPSAATTTPPPSTASPSLPDIATPPRAAPAATTAPQSPQGAEPRHGEAAHLAASLSARGGEAPASINRPTSALLAFQQRQTPPPQPTAATVASAGRPSSSPQAEGTGLSTTTDAAAAKPGTLARTSTTLAGKDTSSTPVPSSRPAATTRVSVAAAAGGKATAGGGATSSVRKGSAVEAEAPKRRKKKKRRVVVLNCNLSKYPVIRQLAEEFGYQQDDDEALEGPNYRFNLIWADTILPMQKLARIQAWQRTNHFPSMHVLCRKVHLGLTLNRMRKPLPQEFSFYPLTWSLRSERAQFCQHMAALGATRKTFILKPNAGCQGKGIVLTRDPLNAVEDLENYIAQEYISRPLLIEGKKFDLRVYVLLSSVKHLSVMVFDEGLVRICAEPYVRPTDANLGNACAHLTNYAINKHSDQFVFNKDGANASVGNKRDFKFFNAWLEGEGHDAAAFWGRVDDIIVKAIVAAHPKLAHVYTSYFPLGNDGFTCFEVLGFDVMVDEKLKPWLMEVNHTPSFACDTPMDYRIKHGLLEEVWRIIHVTPQDKARFTARARKQFEHRLVAALGSAPDARSTAAPSAAAATSGKDAVVTSPPPPGAQGAPCTEGARHQYPPGTVEATAAAVIAQAVASGAAESLVPGELSGDVAADHLALEDSRRVHFRRAYPSRDPVQQQQYQAMLKTARDVCTTERTTASQEQRQNEVRQERERRENGGPGAAGAPWERRLRGGPMPQPKDRDAAPPQPGQQAGAAPATSRRTMSDGASLPASPNVDKVPAPPGGEKAPRSARTSGHTTPVQPAPVDPGVDQAGGAAKERAVAEPKEAAGAKHRTASGADRRARRDSFGDRGGRRGSDSAPVVVAPPAAGPAKGPSDRGAEAPDPREPREADDAGAREQKRLRGEQRRRLQDQMERHRRRIVLGPRLSVFQLRELQLLDAEADAAAGADADDDRSPLRGAPQLPGPAPQPSSRDGAPSISVASSAAAHQQAIMARINGPAVQAPQRGRSTSVPAHAPTAGAGGSGGSGGVHQPPTTVHTQYLINAIAAEHRPLASASAPAVASPSKRGIGAHGGQPSTATLAAMQQQLLQQQESLLQREHELRQQAPPISVGDPGARASGLDDGGATRPQEVKPKGQSSPKPAGSVTLSRDPVGAHSSASVTTAAHVPLRKRDGASLPEHTPHAAAVLTRKQKPQSTSPPSLAGSPLRGGSHPTGDATPPTASMPLPPPQLRETADRPAEPRTVDPRRDAAEEQQGSRRPGAAVNGLPRYPHQPPPAPAVPRAPAAAPLTFYQS